MASVITLAASTSLNDEFADFDVREELERELEKRLVQTDLDARPALKAFEPIADEDQLSLIHSSGPQTIRLVAPAGSGKTQTVIHRVLQQAKTGTRPERVLCLTFDNAAAKALRDKVMEHHTLGVDHSTFQITTLNAFGFRVLKDYFPKEFKQIIEPNRVWRLIREIAYYFPSADQRFHIVPIAWAFDSRGRRRHIQSAGTRNVGGMGILDVDGDSFWQFWNVPFWPFGSIWIGRSDSWALVAPLWGASMAITSCHIILGSLRDARTCRLLDGSVQTRRARRQFA
jgi:hypothetical protein